MHGVDVCYEDPKMDGPKKIGAQFYLQDIQGEKVNILGGHSVGHSKQRSVYVHVSYSERFPR
jgi:hypothetical protein